MSSLLFALALAIALLGGAIYGVTRFVKPLLPSKWKGTRLGKGVTSALPVCLGALLGAFALESLTDLLAVLTDHDTTITFGRGAACVIGMFSGSFAAQIHGVVSNRIKKAGDAK